MPPTTMSHFVRALLERGHAVREVVAADRRSYRLALTTAGLRAHAAAGRAFREADRALHGGPHGRRGRARATLAAIGAAASAAEAQLARRHDRGDGLNARASRVALAGGRPAGRLRDSVVPSNPAAAGSPVRSVAGSPSPSASARARRPRRRPPRRRRRCRATTAGGPTSTRCSRRESDSTPTPGTGMPARRRGSPRPTRSRPGSRP